MAASKPPDGDGDKSAQELWRLLNKPLPGADQKTPPAAPGAGPSAATDPLAAEAAEFAVRELHPESYIPQDSDPVGPVSTDYSQIQRILLDPDSLAEDFEYKPRDAAIEDFDAAIKDYYRGAGAQVACRIHAEREAADRCPNREAYYCQECMVVRRGRLLCRDCADTLYAPSQEQVLLAHELGLERPPMEVVPEAPPEFQLGGGRFGQEGMPSHPVRQLLALLIDLLITRAFWAALLLLLGLFFSDNPSPVFHLFEAPSSEQALTKVLNAFLFYRPAVPWLIIMASCDFLYFFLTLSFNNRTYGMSWLGCRVVTEWGDFVTFGAVALRTLVFMVCLGWPAILLGLFFPGFRGPHDYAAGTLVINYAGVKRVDAYESVQIKL